MNQNMSKLYFKTNGNPDCKIGDEVISITMRSMNKAKHKTPTKRPWVFYTEVFDTNRLCVWKKLVAFRDFGILGGGTALALLLNHRISYDFDIFCLKPIKKKVSLLVKNIFNDVSFDVLVDSSDELTVDLEGLKLTFLYYPFKKEFEEIKTESISLFDVRDLATAKAYAVGRRGVWRDYFDIYFLLKSREVDLESLLKMSKDRYRSLFSEKLFLEQLCYFDDISDFSIEYGRGQTKIEETEVKKYLTETVGQVV